jgi:hypothetical protein
MLQVNESRLISLGRQGKNANELKSWGSDWLDAIFCGRPRKGGNDGGRDLDRFTVNLVKFLLIRRSCYQGLIPATLA